MSAFVGCQGAHRLPVSTTDLLGTLMSAAAYHPEAATQGAEVAAGLAGIDQRGKATVCGLAVKDGVAWIEDYGVERLTWSEVVDRGLAHSHAAASPSEVER